MIYCRYVIGSGGSGTCVNSVTSWLVFSKISYKGVLDTSMKVSCAEGKDLIASS
jgi:hypothetical protein